MAGCNECKHYDSEIGDFVNGQFGKSKQKCNLGKTEEMLGWWAKNGRKQRSDLDDMDCHEHHDSTKALIAANEAVDRMLEILKKEM